MSSDAPHRVLTFDLLEAPARLFAATTMTSVRILSFCVDQSTTTNLTLILQAVSSPSAARLSLSASKSWRIFRVLGFLDEKVAVCLL